VILTRIAKKSLPNVFHAVSWGQPITYELIEELICEAKKNLQNKARLCLHPSPESVQQVTLLAFALPYEDKIHKHPGHTEIILPILGRAIYTTFNENREVLNHTSMSSAEPFPLSTPNNLWHSVRVVSEFFVMLEIGKGPFRPESTIRLDD